MKSRMIEIRRDLLIKDDNDNIMYDISFVYDREWQTWCVSTTVVAENEPSQNDAVIGLIQKLDLHKRMLEEWLKENQQPK